MDVLDMAWLSLAYIIGGKFGLVIMFVVLAILKSIYQDWRKT